MKASHAKSTYPTPARLIGSPVGQAELFNGNVIIHLKSGFKVADVKQSLSLSVEYKDTNPSPRSSFPPFGARFAKGDGGAGTTQKPIILRYDTPLYQY
jgi:hypothetical protein